MSLPPSPLSCASSIEVIAVYSGGGYLPVGGVMVGWGNCPNYRLITGRVVELFVFYLYVCMSGLFDGVKISAKLSIQASKMKFISE